jgi:putative hemolysin
MHNERHVEEPQRLRTQLAADAADVRAAQRLRYRVFAEELGAALTGTDELDQDEFDPYCDHLLVRDTASGAVVGTYRILPAARAREVGGFYTETEFHLGSVLLLPGLVEIGRACIDPAFRSGAVLALLWSGLLAYIQSRGHQHVIGSASIPARADVQAAAQICRRLTQDHLGPAELRVVPRRPFPIAPLDRARDVPTPPLIRGYLRMGAWVCGEPAWDPDFGTADVLLLLAVHRMNQRFIHRFARAA